VRRKITLTMSESQLGQLLRFTDDMMTEIESEIATMDTEQALALKKLRHSLTKLVMQYKEQTA
jgi:hypothetical protein